jgi:hypothetical protein
MRKSCPDGKPVQFYSGLGGFIQLDYAIYDFPKEKHPNTMGASEAENYLTCLTAGTQNYGFRQARPKIHLQFKGGRNKTARLQKKTDLF